jgi:hypothetical protein
MTVTVRDHVPSRHGAVARLGDRVFAVAVLPLFTLPPVPDNPREAASRPERSAPWKLWQVVFLGTVAALLLGGLIGQTFAYLVAEDASWWNPWPQLTSSEQYDVVRSDVAAVALIGAGGAALIAYRRQRTAEAQHDLERQRHELTESTDLRERYASAAE